MFYTVYLNTTLKYMERSNSSPYTPFKMVVINNKNLFCADESRSLESTNER